MAILPSFSVLLKKKLSKTGLREKLHKKKAHVAGLTLFYFCALACSVQGQWFPPAIKVDGTLFSNSTGIPSSGAISSYTASSGSSLTIRFDGTDYVVTYTPAGEPGATGSYTPSTHTFSVESYTISGVDSNETAWPPSTSAGGPPAVWVNGLIWPLSSSTGGIDTYTSSTGKTLSITSGTFVISASGDTTLDAVGGTYVNGILYTGNNAVDVRPVATNGAKLTPAYGPSYGHPGELIAGNLWQFQGTHTSGGVIFDIYAGNYQGQILKIGPSWFTLIDSQNASNSVTGSFNGLFFAGTTPVNIKPINASGDGEGQSYEGIYTLYSHAYNAVYTPWHFYATINGANYYSGNSGQILFISDFQITLVDPTSNLSVSGSGGGELYIYASQCIYITDVLFNKLHHATFIRSTPEFLNQRDRIPV